MAERTGGAGGMTLVHITHEGTEHMGGIGTVLEGLHTSAAFRARVGRSILVGPLPHPWSRFDDPVKRLGPHGVRCDYSGPDGVDRAGLGRILKPVEREYGVRIVFGVREFIDPGGRRAEAEVLLIDVSSPNTERVNGFKWTLFDRYGLDSRRYEHSWDYEEWVRLAEPAYDALAGVLGEMRGPALVIGHEFMGLATAMRCGLDRKRFRTAFHAHECSTARRLVESLPGHDMAFYPAMRWARSEGRSVEQVFGDQSDFARHALVSRSHALDGVMAVGPATAEELRFLSPEMAGADVRVVYNGVPSMKITPEEQRASRRRVMAWLKSVLGFEPDYLITHVTRPVPSKGLWRDAKVCAALEGMIAKEGKRAAYLLLTCGAEVRGREQVEAMARGHGWPRRHVEGYPDLAGPETGVWREFAGVAKGEGSVSVVLVNQFGFTRDRLGSAADAGMSMADLRRAADAELGLAVYEPFGISPLEPLYAGAVCVVSSVSGCLGLAERAMKQEGLGAEGCPVLMTADFLEDERVRGREAGALVHMHSHERDAVEGRVCRRVAEGLFARLARSERERERNLTLGQRLAARMSWDAVVAEDFLPFAERALGK